MLLLWTLMSPWLPVLILVRLPIFVRSPMFGPFSGRGNWPGRFGQFGRLPPPAQSGRSLPPPFGQLGRLLPPFGQLGRSFPPGQLGRLLAFGQRSPLPPCPGRLGSSGRLPAPGHRSPLPP